MQSNRGNTTVGRPADSDRVGDRSVFPTCSGVAIFEIFLPTEATFKIMLGGTWGGILCTLLLSTNGRKLGLLLCV